jgi:serine/threonine protein phosphatase 1
MKTLFNFLRKPDSALDREPRLPDGRRVYAVGDVHGRDDLLQDLLAQIEADDAGRAPASTTIVFLGDLIDRGPQSRQVIERLSTYRHPRIDLAFVFGNHEEVLLRILDGETEFLDDWLRFGGKEFVQSYGIDPAKLASAAPRPSLDRLRAAIPSPHRAFLEGFADTLVCGDYLFVHAGIRPGIPLHRQSHQDLRWIRQPFLEFGGRHEHFIVHGHTISAEVDERHGRIGIDTGAYAHGTLTAIGLEGERRWYLQAMARQDATASIG